MPSPDRLVILDRDGVINLDSDDYVKSLAEWIPYPAAIQSIANLSQAGWTVAVATNQSGIARGYYDEAILNSMHDELRRLVSEAGGKVAHIASCPHGPNDGCDCRKPLPGLLEQIRVALGMKDLEGSWMVGDSLRDLQAGEAVKAHSILVLTGKGRRTLDNHPELADSQHPTLIFGDLSQFSDWLLERKDDG